MHALAELRFVLRLDMDDDVAFRQGVVHRLLDRVRSRVCLPDRGVGRDADDDVGEVAARGLAHPQPPQLHGRVEGLDRPPGRPLRLDGHAVHEHVDVPPHQPARRGQHEHGDEERGDRVGLGIAGAREEQSDQDRGRAEQVASEVQCVPEQRLAAIAARATERDGCAAGVDHDHEQHDDDCVPGRVDLRLGQPGQPRKRLVRDEEAGEDEKAPLGEGREVLRFPVPVRVAAVGGPDGDSDREQRQERGNEVGPRVDCFRDEAEASGREPRAELERDEDAGRDDRDKGRASLRAHTVKARESTPESCGQRRCSVVPRTAAWLVSRGTPGALSSVPATPAEPAEEQPEDDQDDAEPDAPDDQHDDSDDDEYGADAH
jgi:hypothetical protein